MANVKTVQVKEIKVPHYNNAYNGEEGTSLSDVLDICDDGERIQLTITDIYNKETNINLFISNLPYCCGVFELGEISVSRDINITDVTKVLDTLVTKNTNFTLMINTNGIEDSIIFEKALAKCKYFTLVKTFKNRNSKNIIKMWVSNND